MHVGSVEGNYSGRAINFFYQLFVRVKVKSLSRMTQQDISSSKPTRALFLRVNIDHSQEKIIKL